MIPRGFIEEKPALLKMRAQDNLIINKDKDLREN